MSEIMPVRCMLDATRHVVKFRTPAHTVACSLMPLLLAAAACVDAPQARSPWRGWTTLRLKARSVPLLRGRVEFRLREDAGGRRLETSTTASFIGATIARSETTTLLDAVTGRTKEYRSTSHKKGRRYTFGEHGYVVEKLRRTGEDDDGWKVTSTKKFPYPRSDDDGRERRLYDYYGMLLGLGAVALDAPGDEVTLHVATTDGPEAYRIRVEESRRGERTFRDLKTGKMTKLPSREFRLKVAPADPQAAEGFLNMEGDVEIWVEAETKTLLEIVGKIPRVPGKVKLMLSAMG
jgi:hypothetical protein